MYMDIGGSYALPAPREQVWALLRNPEALTRALPGCQSLEREGDERYHVRVSVTVPAVQGVYDCRVRLSDIRSPDTCRVSVEGHSARGTVRGECTIELAAQGAAGTLVTYHGHAQLGGTVASAGMQVAGGALAMLLKSFFARLAAELAAQTPAAAIPDALAEPLSVPAEEPAAAEPIHASVSAAPVERAAAVETPAPSSGGSAPLSPGMAAAFASPPAEAASPAPSAATATVSATAGTQPQRGGTGGLAMLGQAVARLFRGRGSQR
jgi:carbon monoxide dehydrogenase subunit G